MLIKKYRGFSGFFQFQKGKLQYIDTKRNDFFELETSLIQAIYVYINENDSNLSQLDIIGNYDVIKSIELPNEFAKDAKYWIYLHLHFLNKKDTHHGHIKTLPAEVIQFKKNKNIRTFCFAILALFLISGLSRSTTYSLQINQFRKEAKGFSLSELLEEANAKMIREEFNESIHYLLLANSLEPSNNIRNKLDHAYTQRGIYYISVKEMAKARLDFNKITNPTEESVSHIKYVQEFESKNWIKGSDFADLIQLSWKTLMSHLDYGPNQEKNKELQRTWKEFQLKLRYTTNFHPVKEGMKSLFVSTVF